MQPLSNSRLDSIPIFDTHTHFFPPRIFKSIWQYFEQNYWPIYLKDTTDTLANKILMEFNVRHLIVLNYAHKRGTANFLNDWTYNFCSTFKNGRTAIPFGTIHPDDEDCITETERILGSFNFAGIKLQLMVTSFHLSDKRMLPVYEKIIDFKRFLLVHIGTGPNHSNYHPNKTLKCPYVGIKYLRPFLEQYPELKIIVPHLGAMEFDEMWTLVEDFPNLYFDTAMIGVDKNPAFSNPLKDVTNQELQKLADRILFGSDFPNIPYAYQNAIESWLDRRMSLSFYKKLFFENAQRLFRDYI